MKKKGLIISTVVMVMVLVAALSTATFAWFSSTAQAEIKGVTINTVASKGLEVAVKADTEYYSGEVKWNEAGHANKFSSDTLGWGSLVDFTAVTNTTNGTLGSMENAVSLVKTADADAAGVSLTGKVYALQVNSTLESTYTLTNGSVFSQAAVTAGVSYVDKDTNGKNVMKIVTVTAKYNNATKYYIVTAAASYPVGSYVVPIGYNVDAKGQLIPYAYTLAGANADYLALPISVRATMDVKYILCTLKLTPDKGNLANWANYQPGMAAATFINIAGNNTNVTLEPYSNITTGGSAFVDKTANPFEFKFVVAYNNGKDVPAAEAIDYMYTIWVEGTDGQCFNATAGSAFTTEIKYDYIATDATVTETGKTTAGTTTAGGTGVTMASVSYTGSIAYNAKDYYILNISKPFAA